MPHPRQQIREDIAALIREAVPDIDVHMSRSRALAPAETCVLLYVMSETITRPRGAGEGRSGRPLQRSMALDVIVTGTGRDEEAVLDKLDGIARKIELTLNRYEIELGGTSTSYLDDARGVRAEIGMRYTYSFNDAMEA